MNPEFAHSAADGLDIAGITGDDPVNSQIELRRVRWDPLATASQSSKG